MAEGRSHLKNEVIFHANELVTGPMEQGTIKGSIDLNHKGVMLERSSWEAGWKMVLYKPRQVGKVACLSYVHFWTSKQVKWELKEKIILEICEERQQQIFRNLYFSLLLQ